MKTHFNSQQKLLTQLKTRKEQKRLIEEISAKLCPQVSRLE